MRNLKFILSAVAILLVGAIVSGFAARSVVSPDAGEVRSAGVVTVPTVFGQTAEEVLFYPWSMYDTLSLHHPTDDELLYIYDLYYLGSSMDEVKEYLSKGGKYTEASLLLGGFTLIQPVNISWNDMFSSLECIDSQSFQNLGLYLFLKDFPSSAYLGDGREEIPVTLSFALSNGSTESMSFLIRPAQSRELTEKERSDAIKRVENDLRMLLLSTDSNESADSDQYIELYSLLQNFYDYYNTYYNYYDPLVPVDFINFLLAVADQQLFAELLYSGADDPTLSPIDSLLSVIESTTLNIQIITTQQQIVLLFTRDSNVLGVYYDIQLGCYTGIGVTVQR